MNALKEPNAGMSPTANAYLIVGLAAVAVLGVTLMQAAGRWALIPSLIGAAGLAFRWRSAPLVLLASVAIGQLGSNILFGSGFRSRSLAFDLTLCAATVTYVVAQYRLIGLTAGVLPPQPRKAPPVPPRTADTAELVPALLTVAAATIGAFFAWEVVGEVPSPWLIPPASWRVGLLAWVLVGGFAVTAAVLGHLGWRRMSRDEAAMFLQDALWHETRREQRRINRWRAWALRRR
jgi:hypothetical protein